MVIEQAGNGHTSLGHARRVIAPRCPLFRPANMARRPILFPPLLPPRPPSPCRPRGPAYIKRTATNGFGRTCNFH